VLLAAHRMPQETLVRNGNTNTRLTSFVQLWSVGRAERRADEPLLKHQGFTIFHGVVSVEARSPRACREDVFQGGTHGEQKEEAHLDTEEDPQAAQAQPQGQPPVGEPDYPTENAAERPAESPQESRMIGARDACARVSARGDLCS